LELPIGRASHRGEWDEKTGTYHNYWINQIWYVPVVRLVEAYNAVKPWIEQGMTVGISRPLYHDYAGAGLEYGPARSRRQHSSEPAHRGEPALCGDVEFYLMPPKDCKGLNAYLETHTDVPCALYLGQLGDLTFDQMLLSHAWNDYFVYYYENGKPKPLKSDPESEYVISLEREQE
jgi:hypothetical protein